MRRIAIFIAILLGIVVAGCPAHNIHNVDARNGFERQRIEGSISAYSTDIEVTTNHPDMETCVADTGGLPGGEEIDLCADQVRSDKARRTRSLDWQSMPYYGAYGTYSPYAPPVVYGH